jgi:hypothetical protein
VIIVDDNSKRATLLKEELRLKSYQVDVFLDTNNNKKVIELLGTLPMDSSCIVIANERLGLLSGGERTGLTGEYAESGFLFCYNLKKVYPSIVKTTMVIAAIKGYSTLHGFYNVGALRMLVDSLGISGYITKPINSKNILRIVNKIERIIEREAYEQKDPLLPLSYLGTVEWIALNAEFKRKKLQKLIDNHTHTVELIDSNVLPYRFKREEVHREMAYKLEARIMKSIKHIQQVVEAIDRDVLSEERALQQLLPMWGPYNESFEKMKQDRKYPSWENDHYNLKESRRNYISNVYGDRIAKAKFNGVMENLLRGMEYVACIEAELANFVTNVIKIVAKEPQELRVMIKGGEELRALKELFDEIILIRERLKGSIKLQQKQLEIFNEGLEGSPARATGASSPSATKTKALVD